jgi:hypothetical protein
MRGYLEYGKSGKSHTIKDPRKTHRELREMSCVPIMKIALRKS